MATSLAMKRMLRERERLIQPSPSYFVQFNDDNLLSFDAYVLGPEDSLYRHKFIKLHFDVPNNYPLVPPACKYIQHGPGRIHPNLYEEGKVCLSILGTWEGEPWAQSMTIESILITIQSLLDNKPYLHEPRQADRPSYNNFVRYATWSTNLLGYLNNESEPASRHFLEDYLVQNGSEMQLELNRQAKANREKAFDSPYRAKTSQTPKYDALALELGEHISRAAARPPTVPAIIQHPAVAQGDTSVPKAQTTSAQKQAGFNKPANDSQGRKRKIETIDLT